MSLVQLQLFEQLADAESILLAGAGGGFDVFCGLPLYFALRQMGKKVQLANLTFSAVQPDAAVELHPIAHRVNADSDGSKYYFPEKFLCEWFRSRGEALEIVCFSRSGVAPLCEAYEAVVAHYGVDTIVLIDGGTDSLMRGDEAGLGTPEEDAASMIAAASVASVERKLLVCLGFGVDAYHGVCHAQFLEAVAALTEAGAFFGAFSLLPSMDEVKLYREACEAVFADMPDAVSIVNSSILSAIEGKYGDVHATDRTAGSKLWINPLMGLYWGFGLDAVVDRLLYADLVRNTRTFMELGAYIRGYRKGIETRPWEEIEV